MKMENYKKLLSNVLDELKNSNKYGYLTEDEQYIIFPILENCMNCCDIVRTRL